MDSGEECFQVWSASSECVISGDGSLRKWMGLTLRRYSMVGAERWSATSVIGGVYGMYAVVKCDCIGPSSVVGFGLL